MILKGNRRGGSAQLSAHILNEEDNDHVSVHELRGFVSDNLRGALMEAYAVSRGSKCKRFLYSLSLSPPQTENVPVSVFEEAVNRIEEELGFVGQPRALIFHEKEGRRHAHCVWLRVNVQTMKAIDPSCDKLKLRDISRDIYMEQKWTMPRGLMNTEERDPLNFTMADWQQAQRAGIDPRTIKATIQECWAVSDSRAVFAAVLRERGYWLAKGDKRGFVVVDWRGEVYAVARMAGVKAKEVTERLGDCSDLPTVGKTKAMLTDRIDEKRKAFAAEIEDRYADEREFLMEKKRVLVDRQRTDRAKLAEDQNVRRIEETKRRAAQLPRGLKALWFRLTGQYAKTKARIEAEVETARVRDQAELQLLIQGQLNERRRLQAEIGSLRFRRELELKRLARVMSEFANSGKDGPYPRALSFHRRSQRTQSPSPQTPDYGF